MQMSGIIAPNSLTSHAVNSGAPNWTICARAHSHRRRFISRADSAFGVMATTEVGGLWSPSVTAAKVASPDGGLATGVAASGVRVRRHWI
jgi:hypothetical protein